MRVMVSLVVLSLSATAAAAQDSPGAREPSCTCVEMVLPYDCSAAVGPLTGRARGQQDEIRADCAQRWRQQCEAEHGWRACAQVDPSEVAAQCDQIAEQWWSQVAAPQLSQARNDCTAANDAYAQHCETEIRAEACTMCEDMSEEIAEIEVEMASHQAEIDASAGLVVLNADGEMSIEERQSRVDHLQEQLDQRRANYDTLRSTGYCD